jgi:hypothetical protein
MYASQIRAGGGYEGMTVEDKKTNNSLILMAK